MKHLILSLTLGLFIVSCGDGSSSSSPSTTMAALAPQANAQGELQATVDSSSGAMITTASLQSSTNDPLSQFAKIEIPAGALSKNTDIKVFETSSLTSVAPSADFGLTEVKKAGPALVIQGDSSVLTSEITVSVPYDSSASLNLADQQLAVLSLSSNTMDLYHGNQLIVGDKTVSVKVKHFGAFQVVKYSGVVQQQKATVQVSESSLKTVAEVAAAPAVTPAAAPAAEPAPSSSSSIASTPAPVAATPTPTPTPTPSLLNTTWIESCVNGETTSTQVKIIFTSTMFKHNETFFSGRDCNEADKDRSEEYRYTYTFEPISYENQNVYKFTLSRVARALTAFKANSQDFMTQQILSVASVGTEYLAPISTFSIVKVMNIQEAKITISSFTVGDIDDNGNLASGIFTGDRTATVPLSHYYKQ